MGRQLWRWKTSRLLALINVTWVSAFIISWAMCFQVGTLHDENTLPVKSTCIYFLPVLRQMRFSLPAGGLNGWRSKKMCLTRKGKSRERTRCTETVQAWKSTVEPQWRVSRTRYTSPTPQLKDYKMNKTLFFLRFKKFWIFQTLFFSFSKGKNSV